MVEVREEREREKRIAKGHKGRAGRHASVFFNDELFEQIRAEAQSRGWSFSRMVRHLCGASIEGVP